MKSFITILSLALFISCKSEIQVGPDYSKLESIPTKEQVGHSVLPDTIAPVTAPFAMPKFVKPSFPDRSINIKDNIEDPNGLITEIIQDAINNTSTQGGGTVIIPEGEWHTGRITLKSNVNLHFEDGAVLRFSTDVKDYQPAVFTRVESLEVMSLAACIYANNQENIAITGNGKLIGPFDGEIKARSYMKPIETLVDLNKPAEERIHDGSKEDWIFPPKFISPINCKKVYIEGVSLENTAFWNIVPTYCDNVIIRGVYVNSYGIPRGDGIDIESSKNVLIEYSTLNTGDDCFTMKSGRGEDGMKVNKPTENVVVRYCLAQKGHGGITCGSETAGVIRNLYVHDCVFEGTVVGIRFKTRRPRGGGGEHLYYDRIRMNLEATAIKWDMLGTPAYVGELAERLPARPVNKLTPFYKDITMTNLIIENSTHFLKVYGIPESPLTNLTIDNVDAKSSGLIIINDGKNINISNAKIKTPDHVIDILGGDNISLENVEIKTEASALEFPNEEATLNNVKLLK
ncbi:glycoside hydrolase family 28 protein [Aestuariibaculum marinum]|uniref:Right-handed parallel beta-helix repeat-containing protein n=1 Tax=Aestuariibaculum marinum TaxID=2683592 RepID=A0A8J6Q6R6_9FLAO|nr:glycosyl hydrolase family 28 protein [Aestuariibaculum marinum]MBD0824583.1 right-handed parallel beta-helix repeat-containing protein [Aestuariibaculum marinum]